MIWLNTHKPIIHTFTNNEGKFSLSKEPTMFEKKKTLIVEQSDESEQDLT